eukprot:8779036-Alexandrium_andersonii.AAC.1
MAKIYISQLDRGAHFLHAHPMAANSWDEECVEGLMARPEVQRGVGHTCRFGMTAPVACAGVGPVPTGAGRLP